jgi:hypothetical protein
VLRTDGEIVEVDNPAELPDPQRIAHIEEPYFKVTIITPTEYTGALMDLCQQRRGEPRRYHVQPVVGPGGVGKTALASHWGRPPQGTLPAAPGEECSERNTCGGTAYDVDMVAHFEILVGGYGPANSRMPELQ